VALFDPAIRALRRALDINPESHNAWNNFGLALVMQSLAAKENGSPEEAAKKLDEAIEAFRQALWFRADFAGAHYNLANTLDEKGNDVGAARHYREALKIEPQHVNARFQLGLVMLRNGELDAARQTFEQVLQLDPGHRGARGALQEMHRQEAGYPTDGS